MKGTNTLAFCNTELIASAKKFYSAGPRIAILVFQLDRRPVDLDLSRRQHAALVTALRDLGIDVLELPPGPNVIKLFTVYLPIFAMS